MPTLQEYYDRLAEEARRQGVPAEESWKDDLTRIYQGSGGVGARSMEDIYQSIYAHQAERARNDNTPREEDAGTSGNGSRGTGGNGYSLSSVPLPNLPRYDKPPPFQYDPYTSGLSLPTFNPPAAFRWPSVDEVLQDPSYLWRKQQGEDSLQRWAAAKGTLNDSSTATGLIDYGQHAATQEYGAVANRARDAYQTNYQTQTVDPYRYAYQGALDLEAARFNTYRTNRSGAVDAYNTNYQTQYADPYRFEYQREMDLAAPQMAQWMTDADFRNLRFSTDAGFQNLQFSTDAASRLQSQQLGYTDAWNRFLADLEQKRWDKEFRWRTTSQD